MRGASPVRPPSRARRVDVHCADTVPLQVHDGQAVRLICEGDVLLVARGEAGEDALVELFFLVVVLVLGRRGGGGVCEFRR